MAGALPSALLLFAVCQLYAFTHVHAGAYYGHKQLPQQQLPQQHQPMPQIPHLPLGKETYPQQQYLGKDMHHIPYGNEMPILPQYREDSIPQMPIPLGKGKGKGDSHFGNNTKQIHFSHIFVKFLIYKRPRVSFLMWQRWFTYLHCFESKQVFDMERYPLTQ